MKLSQIPASKFPIAFGSSAAGGYINPIPQASQVGIAAGRASLTDGFPPANFIPAAAGGTPPFGGDFNGILNQITLWSQWQNAGGLVPFDSAFAAAIGGYPKSAVLASATAGVVWLNTTDDNANNPDAGGAGWVPITAARAFTPSSVLNSNASTTLTSASLGSCIYLTGTGAQTVVLPNPASITTGNTVTIARSGGGTGIVQAYGGASTIDSGNGIVTSITLLAGEEAEFTWIGTRWIARGTFMARYTGPSAQQNTGASGYQRFSGGMLFQWGQASLPVGTNTVTITLPVAWSIGFRGAASTDTGGNVFSYAVFANPTNPLTQININAPAYWPNQGGGGVIARPAPTALAYWSCWGF